MDYPILISGTAAGTLSVRQDGLYTVFEARLPPSGELTRLWVAGGGETACLGLMEPREKERFLRRRLSARDMRSLPSEISFASTEEPPPQEPEQTRGEQGTPQETDSDEPDSTGPPEEPKTGDGGLLWFSRTDGSLTAFDGRGSLLALPADLRRRDPGARLMSIQGREYMVFRT